jgi:hypothetical protein
VLQLGSSGLLEFGASNAFPVFLMWISSYDFSGNSLMCSIDNGTASECPLVQCVDPDFWRARKQSKNK